MSFVQTLIYSAAFIFLHLREISTKNFEADKAALRAACSEVIGKMVRSVGLLKKAVETNCKVQIQKELKTLQSIPIR